MAFVDAIIILSAPLIKNVAGWLNASLQDYSFETMGLRFWKAVQPYEFERLLKSSGRTLMITIPLVFGLDIGTAQEASLAVVLDILLGSLNKANKGELK